MTSLPVAIIGAGLAGLSCARRLRELEIPFRIIEAADAVGGRLRAGCIPFLLPSFPEARHVLDYESLDLKPLRLACHRNGAFQSLDFTNTKRWPSGDVETSTDQPAIDFLRWAGELTDDAINAHYGPLCGGLFLERELRTSARVFRFMLRQLRETPPVVPAMGMAAIAEQLASRLPADSLRLNARVERIEPGTTALSSRERIDVRAIVVATDGAEAQRLVGEDMPAPAMNGTTILTYPTTQPPLSESTLLLNGNGKGPVNHLVADRSEVKAYTIGVPEQSDDKMDHAIRQQLREWFGTSVESWKCERVARIPNAIPDMSVGVLNPWQRPVRLRPGLYVCGDHRDQGTINGMMESGYRTAQAVAEDIVERRM